MSIESRIKKLEKNVGIGATGSGIAQWAINPELLYWDLKSSADFMKYRYLG